MKQQSTGLGQIVQPSLLALLSASFGFLFYGGWGYWVNIEHGHEMAVKVFMAQGSYSFVLTLVMTLIIEAIYRLFMVLARTRDWGANTIKWLTVILSCLVVYSGSWIVNVLIGTPDILQTVILGYVVGGIYTYFYVFAKASDA